MKLPHRTAARRILVTAVFSLGAKAWAQEAISSPVEKVVAPLLRETGPQTQSKPAAPSGAFFTYGNVSLHPHLLTRWAYATGLPSGGGTNTDTAISTYSPGFRVDAGAHWSLDYVPTWTVYGSDKMSNSVGHAVSLEGAGSIHDWAVRLSEGYVVSSSVLFETGQQTKQTNSLTSVEAGHTFARKLGFQTVLSLGDRSGEGVPGAKDWQSTNSLMFAYSKKLQVGIALGAGYSDLAGQPDTTSGRYMGRLSWVPTDKLKLSFDGGIETLQSRASGARRIQNPIVSGSLAYQPFSVTTLTLSNSQTVTNSLFLDQVTEGSTWNVSLQQRLLGHFYLSTTYSRGDTSYEDLGGLPPTTTVPVSPSGTPALVSQPGRSDQVESFTIGLSTQLFKRLSVATSYQRNSNRSNQAGFGNTTAQYSLELGVRY